MADQEAMPMEAMEAMPMDRNHGPFLGCENTTKTRVSDFVLLVERLKMTRLL